MADEPNPDQVNEPTAPAGLETFWDADAKSLKVDDLAKTFGELNAYKTEQDARLADLPQKPEDYKLEILADFAKTLPKDVQIKFDDKDPAVAEVRALAHELKLPQAAVSRLLTIEAKRTIERETKQREAADKFFADERTKLGDNADTRLKAVDSYVRANFAADEYAEAKVVATTEAGVRFLEKLIAKANGGQIPGSDDNGGGDRPDVKPTAEVLYPSMFKQKAS